MGEWPCQDVLAAGEGERAARGLGKLHSPENQCFVPPLSERPKYLLGQGTDGLERCRIVLKCSIMQGLGESAASSQGCVNETKGCERTCPYRLVENSKGRC